MAQLYTAYVDDSGTHTESEVAIASALVIRTNRIQMLQLEWDALRLNEVFSKFHMSEFSSPTPSRKSEFWGWEKSKHDRVYRRVREIIKEYGLNTISFAVYKKDYDEVVPQEIRHRSGKHHYTWAVRHLIAGLEKWRDYYHISEPFEFIFDHMQKGDDCREEIEEVLDRAKM
jgi:hypothetical protein